MVRNLFISRLAGCTQSLDTEPPRLTPMAACSGLRCPASPKKRQVLVLQKAWRVTKVHDSFAGCFRVFLRAFLCTSVARFIFAARPDGFPTEVGGLKIFTPVDPKMEGWSNVDSWLHFKSHGHFFHVEMFMPRFGLGVMIKGINKSGEATARAATRGDYTRRGLVVFHALRSLIIRHTC